MPVLHAAEPPVRDVRHEAGKSAGPGQSDELIEIILHDKVRILHFPHAQVVPEADPAVQDDGQIFQIHRHWMI